MSNNKKNTVQSIRESQRTYLNRDFDSFRSSLSSYGKAFFSEKNADFGPNGFAGMMIELAAYVGDTLSYYMDHQFQELDLSEAGEPSNVERLIRNTGMKITGASPATVLVDFYIEVPAILERRKYVPKSTLLPVIKEGTTVSSGGGIIFTLYETLDFSRKSSMGNIIATYVTMKSDSSGNPTSFSVKMSGMCISSTTQKEQFVIPNRFEPFRKIMLSNANVTEIIDIIDSEGNEYYEVESLTQDTVFKRVDNLAYDSESVAENIELLPAPRRFITSTSIKSKKTQIQFGGGNAKSTDNDLMPDPSELSIPFYGKRTSVSNFAIDPNRLLNTITLGISPQGTTISVRYRAGGGIKHNVSAGSIRNVNNLKVKFGSNISAPSVSSIRSSLEVDNQKAAAGGENAPTLNEMRSIALSYRNSQSRIVTKDDLVARIYTMPNKFGRVFRVGIRANNNNPLASVISILSRDSDGKLTISSDSLKQNLATYINESRLISDAIDIVDGAVINIAVAYGVTVSGNCNPETVIQKINTSIYSYMNIENFQIEQPIITSDIVNIILNTQDVVSIVNLKFTNRYGVIGDNVYSGISYPIDQNTSRGMIISPPGSIFELKYPNEDIVGTIR